jgi:hypothetical protein
MPKLRKMIKIAPKRPIMHAAKFYNVLFSSFIYPMKIGIRLPFKSEGTTLTSALSKS